MDLVLAFKNWFRNPGAWRFWRLCAGKVWESTFFTTCFRPTSRKYQIGAQTHRELRAGFCAVLCMGRSETKRLGKIFSEFWLRKFRKSRKTMKKACFGPNVQISEIIGVWKSRFLRVFLTLNKTVWYAFVVRYAVAGERISASKIFKDGDCIFLSCCPHFSRFFSLFDVFAQNTVFCSEKLPCVGWLSRRPWCPITRLPNRRAQSQKDSEKSGILWLIIIFGCFEHNLNSKLDFRLFWNFLSQNSEKIFQSPLVSEQFRGGMSQNPTHRFWWPYMPTWYTLAVGGKWVLKKSIFKNFQHIVLIGFGGMGIEIAVPARQ